MSRRLPALVLVLTTVAALVIVGRSTPASVTPVFVPVGTGWMPEVPGGSDLTATWFCPGVPATGEAGVGGQVLIGNHGTAAVSARIEWLAPAGAAAGTEDTGGDDGVATVPVETVEVEPGSIAVLDVTERRSGTFVSAVVEVVGDGVAVEQRSLHPAGTAVTPCANATSDEWYLAEGFTVGGSTNRIVLTNPFEDVVIVDIGFATAEGSRAPAAYQGLPIAPQSVLVLDLGAPGAGAQGEDRLAVKVEATRGRLVVGRAQHLIAGGRLGFTMNLAAPALRDQWWFAGGEKAPGVVERFSIYNPTDTDVEVDAIFLGVSELAEVEPIAVPARQVVVFDPGQVPTLVEGRHAAVFSTRAEPAIVVERSLTRSVDGRPSTSVLMGAPNRPTGPPVPTNWRFVAGPDVPASAALTVYNVDNVDGVIEVAAIGPDGPEPVPGLEAIDLPAASIRVIDLVDPAALGRALLLSSTTRVFVERSLPSDDQGGRSASWGLPAI